VAVLYHGDTPHKINDSGQIRPGRLNAKFIAPAGPPRWQSPTAFAVRRRSPIVHTYLDRGLHE